MVADGGYLRDGGNPASAELNNPNGVAVDSSGNIYIADSINHRIREVSAANGIITAFAGRGIYDGAPATNAVLYFPNRVVVDSNGNVYIADKYSN